MSNLTARQKRKALEALPLDFLKVVVDTFDLVVPDRRRREGLVDVIVRSRKIDFEEVLLALKRDELKAVCRALGLDDGGKVKEEIVRRILGEQASRTKTRSALEVQEPARKKKERMPPKKRSSNQTGLPIAYEHKEQTRLNTPGAGEVDLDRPPAQPTRTYAYDPHLDPQLQWAGKAEHTSFEVDTVSLHTHERVSPQAILRAVRREDVQRSLFGETELEPTKQVDFYSHEVGWTNRLVLGDSLVVMNSLLEREQMAGKVQCIYMDPPYGVKFNSNFQPRISRRDVKDGDDASLTREPEQIQAYRDTWTLGIHSYLTYMRDRLLLARELLHETGSIFVQISDENVHHVRELMAEVFGADNQLPTIVFRKTTGAGSPSGYVEALPQTYDTLVWFAKSRAKAKIRRLYHERDLPEDDNFRWVEASDGSRRHLASTESVTEAVSRGNRVFSANPLTAQSGGPTTQFDFEFEGKRFSPAKGGWKTNFEGISRLARVGRLIARGNTLRFVRFHDDFPCVPVIDIWDDTRQSGFGDDKKYVVQTSTKVIARCLLLSTDPGDLVLDPTCGSGTTAYVAEQWGRRWITTDTSRVALSLARQRLLTAKFPYYELRTNSPRDGFRYKTVPHITLKSIAQNPKLDECKTREEMERVIRESADQETLYDQPFEDNKKIRVSGPFTVEAIPVASMEADDPAVPLENAARDDDLARGGHDASSALPNDLEGFTGYMLDLLRKTGSVWFRTKAGEKKLELTGLHAVKTPYEYLHAEAQTPDGKRVAISFGPKNGPVTPFQVRDAIQQTRGYDVVLFVGFACDPQARGMMDAGVYGRELHFVAAAPDILVQDLLKTSKATRLFTVFGSPDVKLHPAKDGTVSVELKGVDLYDPQTGETSTSKGDDVAAWFLDHDYDGRTFCISQAFFPGGGKNPWEKLQRALKGTIDVEKFEAFKTTRSLPFKRGKRVAVKVIDDRGNEVVKVVE